ncbi:MAG: hypothetical protein KPEEDBHJ_01374 [Anaerolineales bacterium]|nr:hypothetical protein [Anaerolineales bacterium]
MPSYFISIFSTLFYTAIAWFGFKERARILPWIRQWPQHPTLFAIWVIWLVFLLVFAPLSYHEADMGVWRASIQNMLNGEILPENYVYLPVYAWLQSAFVFPFHFIGWDSPLLIVYVVKWFTILAYAACAPFMSGFLPKHSDLAPLGIVLAPVTIFYLFFGTNHIVMFLLLLTALILAGKGQWLWAGFFAAFGCYKFLLVPTFITFGILIFWQYGFKNALQFLLGAVIFIIPNAVYYFFDTGTLLRIVTQQAAIGAHGTHIEPFHFFYTISSRFEGFEAWYIGNKIWFLLSLSGIPISLILFNFKRVNFLQCLAVSYAFVALFALEPFRLEPLIGLVWLDAVERNDLPLQSSVFVTLFIHAAAWYDLANSAFLTFDPAIPADYWAGRGFYLGLTVILMIGVMVIKRQPGNPVYLRLL